MKGQSLVDLVESHGVDPIRHKVTGLISDGTVKPKDCSIRELWEAFVGPCSTTLDYGNRAPGFHLSESAVDSTAFADITGQVLMQRAMDEYERPGYIGDQLFEEVQTNKRMERVPGFTLQDNSEEIEEGEPYPEAGLNDRYVLVESGNKRGVVIKVTEEAIHLDETGNLLRAAKKVGEFIRHDKEKRQILVFTDQTGDNYYYPEGSGESIYSGDNKNLIDDNDLKDWQNVDIALQQLAKQANENGDLVMISPRVVVVPYSRRSIALRIFGATEYRTGADTSEEMASAGEPHIRDLMNGIQPTVLTSPLIDQLCSNNNDDGDEWYIGDPQSGFIYRRHWPFQSFRKGQGSEEEWIKDVIEQFKFREWGSAHCVDHRHVLKNAVE